VSGDSAVLLVGLLFAHFLGDFTPLSTARMQAAKVAGTPLGPIAGHAAIHAVLVTIAVTALATATWELIAIAAAIEFATHFAIDATRGRLARLSPSLVDPARRAYWYALGLDQFAHGTVLVGLVAAVL
jgi:hypothetical protein